MKYLVKWGMTPKNPGLYLPEKIFGEQEIEANSMTGAKRKAKKLTNRCEKISDAYSRYTRTWIYWQDWKNTSEDSASVISSDNVKTTENGLEQEYTAFISIT